MITVLPQPIRHDRTIEPGEMNDWIAFGGAVGAFFLWLWRKTIKAALLWLYNGF